MYAAIRTKNKRMVAQEALTVRGRSVREDQAVLEPEPGPTEIRSDLRKRAS